MFKKVLVLALLAVPCFSQHKALADVANDFWRNEPIQIVKEGVTGAGAFYANGENASVGTSLEGINNTGTSLDYLGTYHRVKVVSSSASDTTGGTGIRSITIYGLDSTWAAISSTLLMSGTDSVSSAATIKFIRVFKIEADSVGSGGVAAGTIKLVSKESDTLLAQIDAGYNQSFMTRYSIPVSCYGYVNSIYAASNVAAKANNVYLYAREYGKAWMRIFPIQINASSFTYDFVMPYEFGAKADIEIRALSSGGSGSISAGFSGWYEP